MWEEAIELSKKKASILESIIFRFNIVGWVECDRTLRFASPNTSQDSNLWLLKIDYPSIELSNQNGR